MPQQPRYTNNERCQAPIRSPNYRVMYLKEGKEHRTAWLSRERAQRALVVMQAKYGKQKAVIYVD